jgi:hypothetical protein
MFKRHDITLLSNPICLNAANEISKDDFYYYDKDGFELNQAEQKFYAEMKFPIQHSILNHTCWQEPWFSLEDHVKNLILDHCIFLCRASYDGAARAQIESIKKYQPLADYLLRTRTKWGYDFALDAVRDGQTFEVLHVEYDHTDFEKFNDHMQIFEWKIRHTDWYDFADKIWARREQWQYLKGYDQNDWKAKYLLGWAKAEYTEKTV